MKKLVPFLKPYKKQLIIGPAFKLAEAIFEIMLPTVMAMLIDNGINKNDMSYIFKMSMVMLLIATFGVIFAYICQYYASVASQGVGTDIRNAMYEKIQTFSHKELDKFGTPSLINRITGDVNLIQNAVAMLIRLVIRAPFLCIGSFVMAMLIDLKLSLILMSAILIFSAFLFLIMKKTVPLYKGVQKKLDEVTVIIRENLVNIRVIRAFAGSGFEKQKFNKLNKSHADAAVYVGKIAALTNPCATLLLNTAAVLVIWFGGIRVNTGHLTQGEVIAYVNYLTQILNAMIIVANLIILFSRAYASANRVEEVLNTETSVLDGEGTEYDDKSNIAVEFKDVSFRYGNVNVLENINLKINRGETIGIIGATGSGKSTLVNLIPRFYDSSEGEIYVGGKNVKQYRLDELRNKVGIVQQKAVLFSGTVTDNLRMGKADAQQSEIEKACEIAQAAEFIPRLENGYETKISQSGSNLSGGQRQRLTIARVLVKKPQILILDDSASALDYATDAALRSAIKESTGDTTVIIVSQRINTVKNADRIIVLDDGFIVGEGEHEELLENCDVYREIAVSQEQAAERRK